MTDISFTSIIKPVTKQDYAKFTASINRSHFVDYPWGVYSSVVKPDVATGYICNCTACLITDGQKAMLMHLLPSSRANHNPERISKFINNHFKIPDKNLQAVVVGSHPEKESQDIFNIFMNFLDKFKIPTTILKTGRAPTDIAYKTSTDEVVITNKYIDLCLIAGRSKQNALETGFEHVKISDRDEL